MENIIITTIIIIVIYLYIIMMDRKTYDNFISGFWKADQNYCDNAEISNMILYIDSIDNTGYLIINKDNDLIENSAFRLEKKIISNYNNLLPFNNNIEYNVKFNSKDNNEFLWDNGNYILKLSIISGTIVIYKEDTIFSILYKDNSVSNKFLEYEKIETIE